MAISALNVQGSGDSLEPGIAKNGNSAGELKTEFLTLMVAQVQNQDPLNPLDGAEYVAQLAQFSTVEGIQNMSSLMKQNNVQLDTLEVLKVAEMVGETVSVKADRIELKKTEDLHGSVVLPENVDDLRVWARSDDSDSMKELKLGAQAAGTINFTLEGLPPGKYTLDIVTSSGTTQNAYTPSLQRPVEKVTVSHDGGQSRLTISGIGEMSLFDITEFLGARS